MVSLARLRAADSDSPRSSCGKCSGSQDHQLLPGWLRGCALSSGVFESAFGQDGSAAEQLPQGLLVAGVADLSLQAFHSERQPRPPDQLPTIPLERLFEDLGPEATASQHMGSLSRALAQFGRPQEQSVAKALLMMASRKGRGLSDEEVDGMSMYQLFSVFAPHNEALGQSDSIAVPSGEADAADWNLETFVQVLNSVASSLNAPVDWKLVIQSLDCAGLESVLDSTTFFEIAKAFMVGTGGTRIPAECLTDRWRHPRSQTAMLTKALAHPDVVDWTGLEEFGGATPEDCISPYSHVALLERLVELDARGLFEVAVKASPDLVLLALASAKPSNNTGLQQQLIVSLLSNLIASYPNSSSKTLRQMWALSPALIEGGVLAMWRKDSSTVQKVLNIALAIHALADMLGPSMPMEFTLDVAMLAYQRQPLPLEKWLSERFSGNGAPPLTACIVHLAKRITTSGPGNAAELSIDAVRIVLRCLYSAAANLPGNLMQDSNIRGDLKRVHDAYTRLNSRVANLSPSNDIGDSSALMGVAVRDLKEPEVASQFEGNRLGNSLDVSSGQDQSQHVNSTNVEARDLAEPFSKDIEDDANFNFHRLYKCQITTEQAVELLRHLQSSDEPRDRKVFACMIHTLFDEYRFFKNYPDKELKITGVLFGALVQYSLFDGVTLELALKCVLDALRSVEDGGQDMRDATGQREVHGGRDGTLSNHNHVDNLGAASLCLGDRDEGKDEEIGRMAKFGLCALDRFRKRLREWPRFCTSVLEIPRLKALAPDLFGEVEKAVAAGRGVPSVHTESSASAAAEVLVSSGSEVDGSLESSPQPAATGPEAAAAAVRALVSSPARSTSSTPMKERPHLSLLKISPSSEGGFHSASLNMDTLLAAQQDSDFVVPEETVQDKIHFIFNNLSQKTLDDKQAELVEFLRPEHHAFLAHYVVVKRASIEQNFHDLYLAFLDKLVPHIPKLFKIVLDRSFENVRVLLSSERIVSSSSERILLKSLGSWIGALTLARNKPILQRDLDLKELMLDAYSRGRLIAVVPFVAKVLVMSVRSKIFRPENPWLRAILSVMKEVYEVEDLKLNVKFEVPLLCKSLNIDISEIVASDLLGALPQPDRQNNPDFASKKSMSSSPMRSSHSSSPSPELRPNYSQFAETSSKAIAPMLPLPGVAATTASSAIHGLGENAGVSALSSSRIELSSGIHGTGIGSRTANKDSVADLSAILGATTLSTGGRNHTNSVHALAGTRQGGIPAMAVTGGLSQRQAPVGVNEGPVFSSLVQNVVVSPSLTVFQNSPNLKQLLPVAIDRAIKDIIQPVAERSCTIASLTTRELTLKDFANETDLGKIRKAATQMVQQLAGSLALVTCKEPLRVSMGNHLRSLLTPAMGGEQNVVEQAAEVICTANLEMGCGIIEQAAKEKAARDLNEVIGPAFAIRRPQQPIYGLIGPPGPELMRVYEDFARLQLASMGEGVRVPSAAVYQNGAPVISSVGQANLGGIPAASGPLLTQPCIAPSGQASATQRPPLSERIQDVGLLPENGSAYIPARPAFSSALPTDNTLDGFAHNFSGSMQVENQIPLGAATTDARSSVPSTQSDSNLAMASPTAMATAIAAVVGTLSTGGASSSQSSQPVTSLSPVPGEDALSTQQVWEKFNTVYPQLVTAINNIVDESSNSKIALADIPAEHDLHQLWVQIPATVKRSVTADEASMAVAQKVFKRLYEGSSSLYHEVHVALLDGLRESCRRLSKELVIWLNYSDEHKKLHRECIVALLKPGSLLNITAYDELLSKAMDGGKNLKALDFAAFLVQHAVIDEPLATAAELALTIEAMAKVGRRPNPPSLASAPQGLMALVESSRSVVHRSVAPSTASSTEGSAHASSNKSYRESEPPDPVEAREFVADTLVGWQRILASDTPRRPVPEHIILTFVNQLRSNALNNDEARERFCRIAVDIVTTVTSKALYARAGVQGASSELEDAPYTAVEATVRLIVAASRPDVSGGGELSMHGIVVLSTFLTALGKDILKFASGADLRPHFRLFSSLMSELAEDVPSVDIGDATIGATVEPDGTSDANKEWDYEAMSKGEAFAFLDDKNRGLMSCARSAANAGGYRGENRMDMSNFMVLYSFAGAFAACTPRAAPGFAFSWLELVASKHIMPRLLASRSGRGWPLCRHFLVSILKFLAPHLREPAHLLTDGVRVLYKGVLRVLLVLLHDFPEFLCDYHFALIDAIPSSCIQLRNLVLAAFPKNMRLPDPFLPELRVEQIAEMSEEPRILSDYTKPLVDTGVKGLIDNFLQNAAFRDSVSQVDLISRLMHPNGASGTRVYNVSAINALALYVGRNAMSRSAHSLAAIIHGPATELLQALLRELDGKGQYYLLNAIANQLRYPNKHTHYYSHVLLLLFRDSTQDSLKERITRVLVERLIACRPHPWGLLVTFIDLIKNPSHNFWSYNFVRCAPQIEQLFENVARFCITPAL